MRASCLYRSKGAGKEAFVSKARGKLTPAGRKLLVESPWVQWRLWAALGLVEAGYWILMLRWSWS